MPGGDVANHLKGEFVSVYVPTTPNPPGGYFVIVARKDVIELEMSVDEALKYIISMGVCRPTENEHAIPLLRRAERRADRQAGEHAGWAHRRRDRRGISSTCATARPGAGGLRPGPRGRLRWPRACATNSCCATGVVRATREHRQRICARARSSAGARGRSAQPSLTPPFQLDDENISETVRLEHRIDLRRDVMQKICACATPPRGARLLDATVHRHRGRCSTSRRPREREFLVPRASTTASSTLAAEPAAVRRC